MISKLQNPKTKSYGELKFLLSGKDFPWFYIDKSTENDVYEVKESESYNLSFLSHAFLTRPGEVNLYPTHNSSHLNLASKLVCEIFKYNNIDVNCIYRINANMVFPSPSRGIKVSRPHRDHCFDHKNLLIYFTNAGGKTIVEDVSKRKDSSYSLSLSHNPKEDDIIVFEGVMHCHEIPQEKRRLVLVVTYI